MARKIKAETNDDCCGPAAGEAYRVEALVAVDERGQMVLPKDIRDRAGIAPGEKLALVARERDGKVCCLYLFKAEELLASVKDVVVTGR